MKSLVLCIFAAGLGAAVLWGFQSISSDTPKAEKTLSPAPPGVSIAAGEPVRTPAFFTGDPRTVDEAVSPVKQANRPVVDVYRATPAVLGTALDQERSLARASFDDGERNRGIQQLQAVYSKAKDRADVDLSAEVERLLATETRLEQRRQYSRYLAHYDRTGRVLHGQLERAAEKIAQAENNTETAFAAWDELMIAYEIATDQRGRQKVFAQLRPFIDRMVLSGRYTPILKTYTVQSGDSLSEIAAKFQATTDGLRRINSLKSDAIQPRMRLRILTGKLRIYVDKSDFRLWATVDDRIFLEFPVGTGRNNATPVGTFVIRVRQKDPAWWRPGESPIPADDPRNILGVRWLGFEDTPQHVGFGIHGTTDPSSLGKESSAGCIRMRNEDIELLYDFVRYGTEVVVRA